MQRPFPAVPLALLALGCAALPLPQPSAGEGQPQETEAETIPFGDRGAAYDAPFFPEARYDANLPSPASLLGHPVGARPAHHAEILRIWRTWAGASPRVSLHSYGRTHEGRELIAAVVTSPANQARIEAIQRSLGRLFDPRKLRDREAETIVADTPACAWMGYSIHGDELSGADASLAVGYRLVASNDPATEALLDALVIVIDPCMNPDGRERIITMMEQTASLVPNLDYASMHRGRWPFGRGNHYLFDMNRDWMAGTQPETRGRWAMARAFHPQLFVDAHEMGPLDTFLFYPQNRPLNPELPPKLVEWQRRFAEGAARAFDQHGWSYYTREWADAWAPFYSDAWGSLIGATGMLYEQAGIGGQPLRRASGEVLTYRESVHHQAVASMANLRTLAEHRAEALRDYLANQRRNISPDAPGNDRMLVVRPMENADRTDEFVRILTGQGIEAFVATQEFRAPNAKSALGAVVEEATFPAGSIVVFARQPLRAMVRAYFGFDPRMPLEDLQREREDLVRKGTSRIYDLTAWSLPHALGLDAWWCGAVDVPRRPLEPVDRGEPRLLGDVAPVAWVVPGADDASVAFAARAMELGLAVLVSDKPFHPDPEGSTEVPRGSLLVRRVENEGTAEAVESRVVRAAREAGVRIVWRVGSQLAPDQGPDLGGGHFHLLARPRVALLGDSPVREDTYGHLWHCLDRRIGVPFTLLDAQRFGDYDLRRYNVLILPPGNLEALVEDHGEALRDWVEDGGTLVACGNAAAALTKGRGGLSEVVLRRDALEDLTPFRMAARRDAEARTVEVDEEAVWSDRQADVETPDPSEAWAPEEVPEEHDRWLRLFSPNGVTLRARADPQSWLTFGVPDELPVFFTGPYVYLSKSPVRTAVRMAERDNLRLGGLVWPEARERLAESAWLTVERLGRGQVVLFAALPAFRGYHLSSARLFANAVVFGPGLGADQPIVW